MSRRVSRGRAPTRLRRAGVVVAVACALAVGLLARGAHAQPTAQLQRELGGIGVDEKRGARLPPDARFTDDQGREVRLADLAGRPLLLTLNYASCPMLCNLQLTGLADALRALGGPPAHARVVRISLNPDEPLKDALNGHRSYLSKAGGGEALDEAMRFMVGPKESIDAVADAIGFRYHKVPETGEYAHVATLVVVTADGRVSDYLHGIEYDPERLRAAAERAAKDEIEPFARAEAVDALLNCFRYDPQGSAAIALFVVRVGGGVVVVGFASFLAAMMLRRRRQKARELGA